LKSVEIIIHDNRRIELFVARHTEGYEVWIVGPFRGRRTILDHRLTHDDLQRYLEYARAGDLVWRNASEAELPHEKHKNALATEKTIKLGRFWDYCDPQYSEMEALARRISGLPDAPSSSLFSIANHLEVIAWLSEEDGWPPVTVGALLGEWTDGVLTMNFKPGNRLDWLCTDPQHPLDFGRRVQAFPPNWWNIVGWRLHIMNMEHKSGTNVVILRVDQDQLHVFETGCPNRIARIFTSVRPIY
jgi:hypothetical protein